MTPLSDASGGFARQLFKDGERLLILSNCQACGKAQIVTCYDGSLQKWESGHACASRAAGAAAA